MTRRVLIQAAIAAVPVLAQTAPPTPQPASEQTPSETVAENARTLESVPLSITTEPAFSFKP